MIMSSTAYPADAQSTNDPIGRSLPRVRPHHRSLPLRVGTRASPLALVQTRDFLSMLTRFCPVLRGMDVFQEHAISTTGDRIQDRRLAEIGGKGLFAKEIHEALSDGRIDFAVHSLKDLETELPGGIVLACTLQREDARDALILGDACGAEAPGDPLACLPLGAVIGTSSVRRQAQLLHVRPDLQIETIRGNVQSRLGKLRNGQYAASLLALAGLRRLGLEHEASVVLESEVMLPAACQGLVGVTVRADDTELRELLAAIEDRLASTKITLDLAIDASDGAGISWLHRNSEVLDKHLEEGKFIMTVRVDETKSDLTKNKFGAVPSVH